MSVNVALLFTNGEISQTVCGCLEGQGFQVITCTTALTFKVQLSSGNIDLAVLELRGFNRESLELCRACREEYPLLPIIGTGELNHELQLILALEQGADDFMPAPIKEGEFVARVRALLRRAEHSRASSSEKLSSSKSIAGLEIDYAGRLVRKNGELLNLTSLEFDILSFLSRSPGTAVHRDELVREVWGYNPNGDYDSTVNAQLCKLRRKIEPDPQHPQVLRTIRGFGYVFAKADA